jgi:hypothetical protein
MFKLIEPANQIVSKKKRQIEKKNKKIKSLIPDEITFVNNRNYDEYCILVYDFFKMNSDSLKAANELKTYIEKGEGKE